MRRFLLPLAAAVAISGFAAQPAAAAERCVGAEGIFVVCAEVGTTGGSPVGTCVYAGGSTCTPVYVDVPGVDEDITRVCILSDCYYGAVGAEILCAYVPSVWNC